MESPRAFCSSVPPADAEPSKSATSFQSMSSSDTTTPDSNLVSPSRRTGSLGNSGMFATPANNACVKEVFAQELEGQLDWRGASEEAKWLKSCGKEPGATASAFTSHTTDLPLSSPRPGACTPTMSEGEAEAGSSGMDDARDGDTDGVVIEGPLEEHKFLFVWRRRYCVLDRTELRIYRSERARRRHPERPKRTIAVDALDVEIPRLARTHLEVFDSGVSCTKPAMTLRTGPGEHWEEYVASSVWLHKFGCVF